MAETFANCFAKTLNEVDEFDFIDLYFRNSLNTTIKIVEKGKESVSELCWEENSKKMINLYMEYIKKQKE